MSPRDDLLLRRKKGAEPVSKLQTEIFLLCTLSLSCFDLASIPLPLSTNAGITGVSYCTLISLFL